MIILIAGDTHTGKTLLAQRLLEKYKYPYLSIDHLKMGLIRSGQCGLSADSSDAELTEYLWPIVREMIKTCIENSQNQIVEGCYIPFGWEKEYLGVVCDVRDGTHDSPHYHSTGFPLVTSKNVTGGEIDLTDCSLISEADFNKINERSKVDMGDIIMPMIGTVGKPVIVNVKPNFAIKNVSLIKFKDDSRVLNTFIRSLLQSDYFDDAVLSKVRGGTQKFISLGDIRKLVVIVPPMELQEQFAAFVEQTDKSKLCGKMEVAA